MGILPAHRLPWFMIFVATVASAYGLAWGLLAVGISALAMLALSSFGPWDLILLLLSAGIAHSLGSSLRWAHRRARDLAKNQGLLTEALQTLTGIEERGALLQTLPRCLARLGEGGHVGVWVPQGKSFRCLNCVPPISLQEISAQGIVGRALRLGKPVYIPDVRREPDHIATPGLATLAELALPLFERGEGVAVLNLERTKPFRPEEVEGLARFADTVSLLLDRLTDLELRRLLSELAAELQEVGTLKEAAERALSLILKGLRLEAGVIWEARGARMQALGCRGVTEPNLLSALQEGLPFGKGLVWEVCRTGTPYYTQPYEEEPREVGELEAMGWSTFVAHPVVTPGAGQSRFVLVVGEKQQRSWRKAEQELLFLFCHTLGIGLERLVEKARFAGVNQLTQELLDRSSEELYQRLLQKAVDQVPGSEVGSLLVLEGGKYRFKAAVGYDLAGLGTFVASPEETLLWYGLGEEQAKQGEPRLLIAGERSIAEVSYQTAPPEVMDTAGRVREIQANLCLPMPYRGEVIAYLNLDNLHDPQAFGQDSLGAARFFAAPLATLLHESRTHQLLEQAALTDSLTGLPNRRAFDRIFLEELERAARYGHPLSLAVLDLKGFKAVNDRLGHTTGDQALIEVAETLDRERRGGDHLFRWGGDEFAAIFPHTTRAEALKVVSRYAQAIGGIRFGESSLGVNIGLATHLEDGRTPDELLIAADTRMYQAKALGVTVASLPEGA
ncbi:diguanylate cyclase [Meiothermus granaticius NBRC 107808]|uniref:Response regulator PleD n=1 Tax=Meiothermus granaticius NBRC 107808 TaxID=1227551 RepID=A0A399FBS7_9DEIN|nr:Response regulator PleD [Meiothermus granaticius NBRC 107808]GEM88016.1 diguanylate cyclase [Meiothermus granaticius NBRC 107808]